MVEPSRTALKRRIGAELKRLRIAKGIKRAEVADELQKAPAWAGHIETGEYLPSASDIKVLLDWYGQPDRIAFLKDLLRRAKRGKDWWINFPTEVPAWFDLYLGLESIVRLLSGYDVMVVHGLLQLPDYAEAVIRGGNPQLSDEEVRRRVDLRMARQEVLKHRPEQDPLELCRIIDEAALRRVVGSPETTQRQIEHLADLVEQSNITLQVLPARIGSHQGINGPFTIMDFPEEFTNDPGAVYVQDRLLGRFYEEPTQIEAYREDWASLQKIASPPDDTPSVLHQLAKEISR